MELGDQPGRCLEMSALAAGTASAKALGWNMSDKLQEQQRLVWPDPRTRGKAGEKASVSLGLCTPC